MVLFGSLVLHHHHHEETFWELFYDLIIVVAFIRISSGTGQEKGDSTSLQRGCSRSDFREESMARFEFAPRDDRSSKNEPKRAESDRDTRF